MRYRLLGQTGLYVSELCLGTMTYGGNSGIWETIGNLQQDAVNEQVRFAVEAGINFIDTANVYATGKSESLLGESLKMLGVKRDQLIVATKATGSMDDSPNGRGQSRHHLFNQVDASLKRLQLDYIDLYQLHGFDPLTPFEESLSALNDLVRSGRVRYIGLCNMAAWQVMKSLSVSERLNLAKFVSVQAYYTVAGRDLERELVPLDPGSKIGIDGVESFGGRLAQRQVQRRRGQGSGGCAARHVRLSGGGQAPRLPLRRCDASHGAGAQDFGRAGRFGLDFGQVFRNNCDHRRKIHGSIAGQYRLDAGPA